MRTGPDNATITEALTMLAHEMAGTSIRQWTDDTTPRTDRPVRFDYRRTTAWCAPHKRFESVTFTH